MDDTERPVKKNHINQDDGKGGLRLRGIQAFVTVFGGFDGFDGSVESTLPSFYWGQNTGQRGNLDGFDGFSGCGGYGGFGRDGYPPP